MTANVSFSSRSAGRQPRNSDNDGRLSVLFLRFRFRLGRVTPGRTTPTKFFRQSCAATWRSFPVVSNHSHDTSQLMTLDEGIRSGQVTVTEAGDERGLIRPGQPIPPQARRRRGQSPGALQQLQPSAASARGRNCDRRQAGSRHRGRPHRPAEYRADRSRRLLRGAGALGGIQRELRLDGSADGAAQRAYSGDGRAQSKPGVGQRARLKCEDGRQL